MHSTLPMPWAWRDYFNHLRTMHDGIRLVDSPGVVFEYDNDDDGAGAILRNSVDADSVKDPLPAIQSLLGQCLTESLMMTYNVPAFPSGPEGVMTFLAMVA